MWASMFRGAKMVNHVLASKSGSIVSYNISCYSSFLLLYYGK